MEAFIVLCISDYVTLIYKTYCVPLFLHSVIMSLSLEQQLLVSLSVVSGYWVASGLASLLLLHVHQVDVLWSGLWGFVFLIECTFCCIFNALLYFLKAVLVTFPIIMRRRMHSLNLSWLELVFLILCLVDSQCSDFLLSASVSISVLWISVDSRNLLIIVWFFLIKIQISKSLKSH